MADKTANAAKVLLRLPKSLHRQLVQQAKRNNVSLNTEIVNQLSGHEASLYKVWLESAQPLLNEAAGLAAKTATDIASAEIISRLLENPALLEQIADLVKASAKPTQSATLLPPKDEPKE